MFPYPIGFLGTATTSGETKFVMEVTTTTPNEDFQINTGFSSGLHSINFNVDWGDGNSDSGVVHDITHTYAVAGSYDVKIDGVFSMNMQQAGGAHALRVTKLKNWGTNECNFASIYRLFMGCKNMTYEATDYPDLSTLPGGNNGALAETFRDCEAITSLDLSNWQDTDKINRSNNAFLRMKNCELIDLTGWDFSNFTSCKAMFSTIGTLTTNGCVVKMPNADLTGANGANAVDSIFTSCKLAEGTDIDNWTLPTAAQSWYAFMYGHKGNWSGFSDFSFLQTWSNKKPTTIFRAFRANTSTSTIMTSFNITGFDFSACLSFREGWMYNAGLTSITALNTIVSTSVTGIQEKMFFGCKSLGNLDDIPTAFWEGWGSVTDVENLFFQVGVSIAGGVNPPDFGNATFGGSLTFQSMFQQARFNANVDTSNFDMSSLSGGSANSGAIKGMFYLSDGITSVDGSGWAMSATGFKTMRDAFRSSEITSVDLSDTNSDFSALISIQDAARSSAGITSFAWPSNADFSSLTTATNFTDASSQPMTTAQYDNFLTRIDATNSNTGVTYSMGSCTYTGGGAVATARANIVAAGNTIIDGGIA